MEHKAYWALKKINLDLDAAGKHRTPENTPPTNHASTSANPNLEISLAFIEANYEVLEPLLRERRSQMRNEDLHTELKSYSEEYEKEREMEPRPAHVRETTPVLRTRSSHARRQRGRAVEFEDAPNRDVSKVERELEGFPAQSVRSSNAIALDSPYLLVFITGTSQSRQHGFPFITVNAKEYHSECSSNYHKDNA
nr:reverse transcriptase domain-containing protein [Tanacetum cinerariifolium]